MNVRWVDDERPVPTLGSLVLLKKEVVAAVALHGKLAAASLINPLFGATMGLELRHTR